MRLIIPIALFAIFVVYLVYLALVKKEANTRSTEKLWYESRSNALGCTPSANLANNRMDVDLI